MLKDFTLHQYTVYRQGQVTMSSWVELGSSLLQFNTGPVADLLSFHKLFDFALGRTPICKTGILFETS